jgi:acid phosphatase type 7
VIAAAGDIACGPGDPAYNGGRGIPGECRMKATSDLLLGRRVTAVLTLGDNQYSDGALEKFRWSYARTWGRALSITHPSIGNHEYFTAKAAGYFAYFGAVAGKPSKGYYSFHVAGWHMIALNSEIARRPGSPQISWLEKDLVAHPAKCALAYFHRPLFSSRGGDPVRSLWRPLYRRGVDLVLSGHDHDYERFAPQTPAGVLSRKRGIRGFVVGTGGRSLDPFRAVERNSRFRDSTHFGVLKLTLRRHGYRWRFVSIRRRTIDSGKGRCH